MEERLYSRRNAIVFKKTTEDFGGLSNMAGGYPLIIGNIKILTSEALYQACRFPHLPDVQSLIINERSPMTAKMKSKPYRKRSREDWDDIRVQVMRWCLRVKLFQNWSKFSSLLRATGSLPIVEDSNRDAFWGAKPDGDYLRGVNCLGRLLMELRDELPTFDSVECVLHSPKIPQFLLYGKAIERIKLDNNDIKAVINKEIAEQVSFYDKKNEAILELVNKEKQEQTGTILRVIDEIYAGNTTATVEMIDYFISEKTDSAYLKELKNQVLKAISTKKADPYFSKTMATALLDSKLKLTTRYFFALILYSVSAKKDFENGLLETFVAASLKTPNPLGKFYYSLIQKISPDKSFLKLYEKHIRSVARTKSMTHIFGLEMNQNTLEELIEAYQNDGSTLIKEFHGNPVKMVAREVLNKLKLSFPIEPFDICYELGITVIYLDLPSHVDGFTLKNNDASRGVIALNALYSGSAREKFTLAHELGHYLIHDFKDDEFVLSNYGFYANISNSSVNEKEANQFAELILIPEGSDGEYELKNLDRPFVKNISLLSNRWKISTSVLISKFIKTTTFPIKLLIYKHDEIVFKEYSKNWEDEVADHYEETFDTQNGLVYTLIYSI